MILNCFKTEFKPEDNGIYDNITDYLDAKLVFSDFTFKFVKPELETSIKITGNFNSYPTKFFDYVALSEGLNSHVYYYYVTNFKWLSSDTIKVELTMDTLNSFYEEILGNLDTRNSKVSRRLKDRWQILSGKVYPKIDNFPESITQPTLYRTSDAEVVGGDEKHWYLVYKTDYENLSEQQLKTAPVSCYAFYEEPLKTISATAGEVTIPADSFYGANWFSLNEPGDSATLIQADGTEINVVLKQNSMLFWTVESNKINFYSAIYSGTTSIGVNFTLTECVKIKFTKAKNYFKQSSVLPTINLGYSTKVADINNFVNIKNSTSWDDPVFINAGSTSADVMSFKVWFESNKTNSTLIKILELPYAPFNLEKNGDSVLIPAGWEVVNNAFHLTTATEFKSALTAVEHWVPKSPEKKDIDVNANRVNKWETKLYNSAYKMNKLVYDDQSWSDRPENVNPLNLAEAMAINFNFSTSMDNSMLFTIESKNNFLETDYGDVITCNRSTEIPFYTNEYLNYLRFGKKIDEKNANRAIAQTLLSGIGSTIGSSGSAALGFSQLKSGALGTPFTIATSVISAASTIVSTIFTAQKAREEIDAKIDNYTHQASGISSSNDLSIFKVYGKNKLLNLHYRALPTIESALGDYFYRFGYECDEPLGANFLTDNVRFYFNYFALDPKWKDDSIFDDFRQDIEARMKAGFVIFWNHAGYDLNFTKENWEETLIRWKETNETR